MFAFTGGEDSILCFPWLTGCCNLLCHQHYPPTFTEVLRTFLMKVRSNTV